MAAALEFGAAEDIRPGRSPSPTAQIYWIVAAGVLAFLLQRRRVCLPSPWRCSCCVCMICGDREDVIYSARSFFGVLRVDDRPLRSDGEWLVYHTLMHGSTMHGEQSRDPDDALDPWTYYHRTGPVGDVFDALEQRDGISSPRPHRRRGPGDRVRRRLRPTRADAHLFRDRRGGAADLAGPQVLHLSHQLPACSRRSAWAMPG